MIPVSEPWLVGRELEYVSECLTTGWISSSGRFLDAFEEAWAHECGRRYAVAVSNGTVALQLAVAALELAPGSEIIMPSFTIISCAMAAIYNDCVPVLVDCDADTWCMDVSELEAKLTPRTAAIMPVHIYGHPVDMDPVLQLAARHGLRVIEDAAEAHGAWYQSATSGTSKPCGSMGDVSTFSFYANKLVTTGEGGMLLTDDRDLRDRARLWRNLGFGTERRFLHEHLGFNFRMTNVQAAIGLAQVERLPATIDRKRRMGQEYTRLLAGVPGLQLPTERSYARSVYWMYGIVLSDEVPMDGTRFGALMREHGVETRPFFVGMHEQPALRARGLFTDESYPVSERLARRGVYLPSGAGLEQEQLEVVATAVTDVLAHG